MFCTNCGKDIDDNAVICPHCGVPTRNSNPAPQSNETNTIAIVGFILSFFFALIGLICSIIGLNKSKQLGGNGRGLAIAGIVVSVLEMAFSIIIGIFYYSAILTVLG